MSKITTQIFGFIITILVIRKLAVVTYGTYNFLISSLVVFNLFAVSPINSIFNRYIPELIQNKEYTKLKKIIFYGLTLSVFIFALILIGIYSLRNPFGNFFHIPNFESHFFAFIIFVLLGFLKVLIVAIIAALLLHKVSSILNIIHAAVHSLTYLYFLPVLTVNLMLYIEASLTFLYLLPSTVVLLRFYRNLDFESSKVQGSPVTRRRVFRFGLFSSLNELGAGIVGKTSDYFIISAISNQYYVGLYAFAYKFYYMIYKILPLKDFLTILRPLFIQKFTEKYRKEEFVQVYNFIIKVMLPVYMLPTIYFFIFGKSVIKYIYDPKYLDAYWVTCIIMFSNLFMAFFYPLTLTLILKEKMEIALLSKTVVVFSIFAGIYGMKHFGIIGVATATMIGDFLRNIIMLVMMRKKADIIYKFKELKKYLYVSVFLIAVFYLTQSFIGGILELLIISTIFAFIALALLIMYHPFNKKDLQLLERISQSSRIFKKVTPYIVKFYSLKPKFAANFFS